MHVKEEKSYLEIGSSEEMTKVNLNHDVDSVIYPSK